MVIDLLHNSELYAISFRRGQMWLALRTVCDWMDNQDLSFDENCAREMSVRIQDAVGKPHERTEAF